MLRNFVFFFFLALSSSLKAQFADPVFLTETYQDLVTCLAWDADIDGDMDLVMSSSVNPALGMTMNTSPGIHHGLQLLTTQNFPVSEFFSADLNGDGWSDLVTYSDSLDQITVFPQTGAGPGPEMLFLTETDAYLSFQFVDVDHDGVTDFSYATADGVYVMPVINFTPILPVELYNPVEDVTAFTIGDSDNDTDMDLVIGTTAGVRIYPRNSSGVYNPGYTVPNSAATKWLKLEQVMGSPSKELFYAKSNLYWTYNNGSNNFLGENQLSISTNYTEISVMGQDMDDDADVDMVISTKTGDDSGYAKYFPNTGSGFEEPGFWDVAQTRSGRFMMTDINNDGKKDFLNCRPFSPGDDHNYFGWYINKPGFEIVNGGSHIVVYPLHSNYGAGSSPLHAMAFGDMDGDDDLDLVLGSSSKMCWYPNSGGGNFDEAPHFIDNSSGGAYSKIKLFDYDSDGDLDIVYYTKKWENDGNGNFTPATFATHPAPYSGDINQDGYTDYYTIDQDYLRIYYGNATGWNTTAALVSHEFGSLTVINSKIGAFSWDQIPNDICFMTDYNGAYVNLIMFRQSGLGSWYSNSESSCYRTPPIIADFDHDGDLDKKCPIGDAWHELTNMGYTLQGNHMNVPQSDLDYLADSNAKEYFYADIDGDPHTDMLLWKKTMTENEVAWIEVNVVDSVQTTTLLNGDLIETANFMAYDLDYDGDAEVICTCQDGSVCILRNLTFTPVCVPADFNCDFSVDEDDLTAFMENFGCLAVCEVYDLNEDGVVNTQDLMILVGAMEE